jgi:hypothetical protein
VRARLRMLLNGREMILTRSPLTPPAPPVPRHRSRATFPSAGEESSIAMVGSGEVERNTIVRNSRTLREEK